MTNDINNLNPDSIDRLNEIELVEVNGIYYATSLNIASYTEKSHGNVIRDIEKLIVKLKAQLRINLGNYFIETTYLDAKGEKRKMYFVSQKGVALYITKDESLATLLAERCDMFEIISNYVPPERDNTSYIYLMKDRDRFKIGISRDVEARLKSLRTANPTIEMIYKSPILSINKARSVEANIISSFNNIGGEWFVYKGCDNEVVSKIRLLVG